MLQLIDELVSVRCQMLMGVNERRHDGFAGQIHARRARRNVDLAPSANRSELTVGNDEDSIRDGSASTSGNEPGSLECCNGRSLLRLGRSQFQATHSQKDSDRKKQTGKKLPLARQGIHDAHRDFPPSSWIALVSEPSRVPVTHIVCKRSLLAGTAGIIRPTALASADLKLTAQRGTYGCPRTPRGM